LTGPEHFKTAEDLIGGVEEHGDDFTPEGRADVIAVAQVHATLALAAASATGLADHAGVDWEEWRPVVSRVKRPSDDAMAVGTEQAK
jgi:hypothetical protein